MHVDKSINIIDDYELSMKLDHFLQSRSQDISVKRRLKEWASADFCDHEKEPLVSFQMNGNVQFFGLFRPACDECLKRNSINTDLPMNILEKSRDFNGRKMVMVSCEEFFMSKYNRFMKPLHDGGCDSFDGSINFNRHGDLCWKCKDAHKTDIFHNDSSRSNITIDQKRHSGPSFQLTYHIDNIGPNLPQGINSIKLFLLPKKSFLV